YSIHLTNINTSNHSIQAFTEILLTPKIEGLEQVTLELKDLVVDSVFKADGLLDFEQSGDTLYINMEQAANIGDTLDFAVYYHGFPFHEAWGGFHFSSNYSFNLGVGFVSIPHNLGKTWFPCIDDFTDRATYDVFITVDNNLKGISGGTLVNVADEGNGKLTWHWAYEHPLPTYLVSVMTGDYVLYEDDFFGMEDTIPITIYTRPTEAGKVEGSFSKLKEILQFFEDKFGPYPFERVGYTGTAIGAMEHASNISYPNSSINGNSSNEWLYTHELSHMWFGNKVTCSSAGDMWLNEGWATFCEKYYKEVIYSHEIFDDEMRTLNKDVLQKAHVTDGDYWALNNIPQLYTYGSTAYDKGGSVANTLRGYLGDSIFFEAITAYLDEFAYQSVSSEDMRDFLTSYTTIDMSSFFDAWVFTPGTPHFAIDSTKVTENSGNYAVDIFLKQKYKGADYLADDNILEIAFVDEQFNFITDTVHFSGRTGHSVKSMPFYPVLVMMDPFEKIGDATTDNFQYFTQPLEYSFPETYFKIMIDQLSDSALVRATHNWVAPDSLKVRVDSLRLSPYRHWKIEGIFPDGMQAKGSFFYDMGNSLDNDLILSENDSVVILYREGAWDDWHEISQTRQGAWLIGYIIVDELLPGEYTLAVWNRQWVYNPEIIEDEVVKIYPNPSKGNLTFEFAERGNYDVFLYNTNGVLLENFIVKGKKKNWKWDGNQAFKGMVLVKIIENNQLISAQKLIFN
ncbi:MAG TPA: M1 family aminopeptidase, partial [Bacteroidales bacterium]